MKNRNRNPSKDARSLTPLAPPGIVKKYAAAPNPTETVNANANPASNPNTPATRPTTALRERKEFLNSRHFNHTSAKS
jgi:hypothetical protein